MHSSPDVSLPDKPNLIWHDFPADSFLWLSGTRRAFPLHCAETQCHNKNLLTETPTFWKTSLLSQNVLYFHSVVFFCFFLRKHLFRIFTSPNVTWGCRLTMFTVRRAQNVWNKYTAGIFSQMIKQKNMVCWWFTKIACANVGRCRKHNDPWTRGEYTHFQSGNINSGWIVVFFDVLIVNKFKNES